MSLLPNSQAPRSASLLVISPLPIYTIIPSSQPFLHNICYLSLLISTFSQHPTQHCDLLRDWLSLRYPLHHNIDLPALPLCWIPHCLHEIKFTLSLRSRSLCLASHDFLASASTQQFPSMAKGLLTTCTSPTPGFSSPSHCGTLFPQQPVPSFLLPTCNQGLQSPPKPSSQSLQDSLSALFISPVIMHCLVILYSLARNRH